MIDALICMKKALTNNQGICKDLPYLHTNCIIHLDLKHENILLDDNMMPKILNFCLSKLLQGKAKPSYCSKTGRQNWNC
uniref:Protein kinase domain-containing protein n=1 Tax=Triticum urartu TaxID=4572 RepID=A0A8R7UHP3_TRIUA